MQADRVVIMDNGKVTLQGTPREVFSMVDRLHEMGLEAPQGAEVISLIKKSGGSIDDALTEEECIASVAKYLTE